MVCELHFNKAVKISTGTVSDDQETSWQITLFLGTPFHPPALSTPVPQIFAQLSSHAFKCSWYFFELMDIVIPV